MNTQPPQEPDIIIQKNSNFDLPISETTSESYSRDALIDSIKSPYQKRAKALLDSIEADGNFSIDTTTGQISHNSILIGKLSELLSDLWDRQKKSDQSVKTFVQILHNSGLSRFIPKSKSIKVDQSTFLNNTYNSEKWYFIGQ